MNFDQIYPKFDTGILPLNPNKHFKIQLDWSTHTQVIVAIFAKCANRRKKMKKAFLKAWFLVSRKWLKKLSLNLECGLPWVEGTSIANVVPFRLNIMELHMRENAEFVVLVYSLCLHSPRFLVPDDTLPCVLIYLIIYFVAYGKHSGKLCT